MARFTKFLVCMGLVFVSELAFTQGSNLAVYQQQMPIGDKHYAQGHSLLNQGLAMLNEGRPGAASLAFVHSNIEFGKAFSAYETAGGHLIQYAMSLGIEPYTLGVWAGLSTKYDATRIMTATTASAYDKASAQVPSGGPTTDSKKKDEAEGLTDYFQRQDDYCLSFGGPTCENIPYGAGKMGGGGGGAMNWNDLSHRLHEQFMNGSDGLSSMYTFGQ